MKTTRTYKQVQVYFIAFPGTKQAFPGTAPDKSPDGREVRAAGIPMVLGAPAFNAYPDDLDDEERVQDEAMRLADWALETNPELFGLPDEDDLDYQGYNDKSIELAEIIMDTIAGETRREFTPENPRCFWQWVQDTEIVPGVVVRAACFEHQETAR